MSAASPFTARTAPARPERACGEGAGTHAAWPVEQTEIGLQYVIPGCERRSPPPHVQGGER